jgi:superfamily I DNA/RNA helicase
MKDYNGPARVSGSAGTGKTVVALHRAVHLARVNPDARVLLTTFSDTLANALRTKFRHLLWNEPRLAERIDIYSFNAIGKRLYKGNVGPVKLVNQELIKYLLQKASNEVGGHKFTFHFLFTEWEQMVDAWQLGSWEEYRDVARLGRKTRLPETQRVVLWSIFEKVISDLAEQKLLTLAAMFTQLAVKVMETKKRPFDFVVVDEAQDVGIPHLRFFAALAGGSANGLFFAGDLGQRIFQLPFSWKSLGVDVRGRARNLRVNYRTSHQIRTQADRLLGPEVADVDGNKEERSDTVSVFNGPPPIVQIFPDETTECEAVAAWLKQQVEANVLPHEMGVFVRSAAQINRAKEALHRAAMQFKVLDEHVETEAGFVSISTMHLAKGLEFRSVVVMACDDEIIPLQERIETVGDDADLKEVYDTERQLLYVACTRARDHLLVTSAEPASEFLADLAAS